MRTLITVPLTVGRPKLAFWGGLGVKALCVKAGNLQQMYRPAPSP